MGDPKPARSPCVTISHDKGFRAPCSASRELGLKQPSLSQQLTILRDAGLVTARRDGKTIIYRLTDGRALPILDALEHALTWNHNRGRTPPQTAAPSVTCVPVNPRSRRSDATECGLFLVGGWAAGQGRDA